MSGPRPGVRVGVDVGSVRVGVSASDAAGSVVLPVTTLVRGRATVAELASLVRDRAAVEVVVGLPLGLSGTEGAAAAAARGLAGELAAAVTPVPVRLVDERFSTAGAVRELQPSRGRDERRRAPGERAGRRAGTHRPDHHVDSRALRSVVDQQAAVIILRTALDAETATGRPPGTLVTTGGTR